MLEELGTFVQGCVDELIAVLVIGGVLLFVYWGVLIPEALWVAFGMVMQYYFVKKTLIAAQNGA